MAEPAEITGLLKSWGAGDQQALDRLVPLVYGQLRAQARRYLRHERPGATLQSAALVHELYLRLTRAQRVDWQDRAHFFALAARLMRRILVDAARARAADKRGGDGPIPGGAAADLDAIPSPESETASVLCALDDALVELALVDSRRAKVIELRFFGGLSVEETANVLEVSPQTVMRDWRLAKVWLARQLGAPDRPSVTMG